MKTRLLSCLFLFTLFCYACNYSAKTIDITIKEIADTIPNDGLVIPWIQNNSDVLNFDPVFELSSDHSETAAIGRIAATHEGFILYIEVSDSYHINNQTEGAIWDGDAIQVGIDAFGDGVGNRSPDVAYVGPDDAAITIALTNNGPRAWAHYHGIPERAGPQIDLNPDIHRDERRNITIYNILFRWSHFNLKPGASNKMGLAVQINDTDEGPEQIRLKWGNGAGGNLKPGQFIKVFLDEPHDDLFTVLAVKTDLWDKSDILRAIVAVKSKETSVLTVADMGNTIFEYEIKPSENISRFELSLKPTVYGEEKALDVIIQRGNTIKETSRIEMKYPGLAIENLLNLLKEKSTDNPDRLEAMYYSALLKLVDNQWRIALGNLGEDEYDLQQCGTYCGYIYEEIKNHTQLSSDILAGKKALVSTFNSSVDSSLQFYKLYFPVNYTGNENYSLIVDLHGMGNPYPLAFVSSDPDKTIGTEDITSNQTMAFIIQPWGRGNAFYREKAGLDIYDAIDVARKLYNIDTTRIFLTGFSMGGFGTWIHVLESPATWRAAAIAAGGSRGYENLENLSKLSNLPILIWHGDKDGAVSVNEAYKIQDWLRSVGNEPEMQIIEGRGHQITSEDRMEIYRWLLNHD